MAYTLHIHLTQIFFIKFASFSVTSHEHCDDEQDDCYIKWFLVTCSVTVVSWKVTCDFGVVGGNILQLQCGCIPGCSVLFDVLLDLTKNAMRIPRSHGTSILCL